MYYLNSFFLYSLLGFIMESTLFKNTSPSRVSGVLNGPITIVYGIGGLTIILIDKYLIPKIKTNKIIKIIISFLIYAITLGIIEYLCGYLCSIIFDTEMWNYNNKKYHLGKYTCLEYLPIWGLIAIIITNVLKPYINKIIKIIPQEATYLITVVFFLDTIITLLIK